MILPTTGVAFLAYASVSLLWSTQPLVGAMHLVSLVLAFISGYFVKDLSNLVLVYLGFLAINLLLVFYPENDMLNLSFGIFGNPNYLGCALALGLAAAYVYVQWWFLPIGFAGLVYSQSRGAIIAVVGAAILALPWKAKSIVIACGLFAFALSGSAHRGSDSIAARLGVWESTITNLTFFGHGYGSFADWYQALPVKINMTLTIPQHAYNDYFELLSDIGIGTIPLWIFLIYLLAQAGRQRLILQTFLLLSLTFYPLYLLGLGQLFALVAGHSTRKEANHGALQT